MESKSPSQSLLSAVVMLALISANASAETVWLSDLDLTKMTSGYQQAQADKSITGKSLSIGGRKFERGIGTHAESVFYVNLNKQANRFSAIAGIDDDTEGKGSVVFKIYADGKTVFNSGAMKGGQPGKTVELSLSDVQTVILTVSSAADGKDFDHADWADAKFEVTGSKPQAIDPPAEKKEILTPAPGPAPKLNSPAVFSARPGNPFIYRIPATGKRPMRFEADKLPESLVLDSSTGIISGNSPKQRGEYLINLKAVNETGSDEKEFKLIVGDKLALTPPMGWNSWYIHYTRVSDTDMRLAADAMIASGMADYGYMYVNIDEGWSKKEGDEPYRDDCGVILANERFPDMKAMTDYIHAKGLRAGLYSSPGPWNCARHVGSLGHEQIDAQQYAKWGFDFLKYDSCSYHRSVAIDKTRYEYTKPYALMGEILKNLDRDMIYNLCQYGMSNVWEWGADVEGQTWRTMGDVGLMSFLQAGLRNCKYADYAGPGRWNDPDYILIGWVGEARKKGEGEPTKLTGNEQYQYMSMWSLMASPLFFSGDMTRLDDFTLNVLCNSEIIAVNQDQLGKQGKIVAETDDYFILVKPLSDGSISAGIFNKSEVEISIPVKWSQLGIKGKQVLRDLWRQKDIGTFKNQFESKVPRHGVLVLGIRNASES